MHGVYTYNRRMIKYVKFSDRDLIHRYIVLKQFEALERTSQGNVEQYYDDYSEALTGD